MTNHIKSGYRVIGPNTSTGELCTWYWATEDEVNTFAKHLAQSVDEEVEVCKFISCWKKVSPVEQIMATDIPKPE